MSEDRSKNWMEERRRVANDPFGKHEALHAISMIEGLFETWVRDHPAIDWRPSLKEQAEAVADGLADLYQASAAAFE